MIYFQLTSLLSENTFIEEKTVIYTKCSLQTYNLMLKILINCIFYCSLHQINILTVLDLHLSGSKLRPAHPVTFLNHPIKCRSHLHPWVRAISCNSNTKVHRHCVVCVFLGERDNANGSYSTAGFSQFDLIALLTPLSDAAAQRASSQPLIKAPVSSN